MTKGFIILISILVLISGCGKVSSNLEVSDVREISVQNGEIHSMSPDGKLILSLDDEKMYFYETSTMDEVEDVSLRDVHGLDKGSIQWSPNSKFITFTQDFYKLMIEPDIYVVDIENGDIDNITDDGVDKVSFTEANDEAKLDILPVWTKDSKNIMFTRIIFDDDDRETILFQTDIKGENEEKLTNRSIGEGATLVSLNNADSAKRTYFTVMAPKIDDKDNGIWVIDNGKAKQTDFEREQERVPAVLAEVTSNGEYGIVYYLLFMQTAYNDETIFSIVNLKTGDEMPVKGEEAGKDDELMREYSAVFSPDGKRVLYLYGNNESEISLAVQDVEGSDETVLWSEKRVSIVPRSGMFSPPNLYWAKNNTILFFSSTNTGYIIELD
jgi:hypothetical protein